MGRPVEEIADKPSTSPNEMFTGPGRYALKVRGDSMIDIGVMDGDYVVIQRVETDGNLVGMSGYVNGDIVVALVDCEEATLKRIFYHPNGIVELKPENSQMESITYPAERVQIQGRMVGLFRTYIYV